MKTTVNAVIDAFNGDIIINLEEDVTNESPEVVVAISKSLWDKGATLIAALNAAGIDKAVWGGTLG